MTTFGHKFQFPFQSKVALILTELESDEATIK